MTSTREDTDVSGELTERQAVESAAPATRPGPARRHVSEPEHANGLIAEDLLVEDVSIDGMCGVY
jgi:mycofactocin precursor